ncbi:aegerolysin family protein, partial [Pseudomonas aeruginosa]|uniref:aegerolysin family protein n=1 Tax=Pseudomonas aeruginosa TaxID=287 RepID=UPI001FB68622
ASCGRENASSGTQGSFDCYDGNTKMGTFSWDDPWKSAATCAAGFGGLRFHKYRKKYDGKKYFSSSAGFFSASDEIPWRSPSRGLVLSVPPL